MELTQSFLLSVTRVRLSLYEQRILTKIVEHAQSRLEGLPLKHMQCKIPHDFTQEKITLPIRYILNEGDKHYNYVYDACKALMSRKFEFYDPDTRNFYATTIISDVRHQFKKGYITFHVSSILFDVLFDFSKGYKSYDLEVALTLPSPYAVRMYVLLNNQDAPLYWSVEKLKAMFGVADKYKQTADFIKKIIEPSRKALIELGANSFTYSRIMDGQRVSGLRFFPVKSLKKEQNYYGDLTKEQIVQAVAVRQYLATYAGFIPKELDIQKRVIQKFAQVPDCISMLQQIDHRAKKKDAAKGYYIAAMKDVAKDLG